MSNKIGRFEILSEITRSETGAVYKVSDPESGQTVALKTLQLHMLGDQAGALVQRILQEAAGSKALSSHNIAQLFGAEEIDGHFCACMEYVQGNSIATMLTRKEGFSIWDLQDITRQACQALEHAHSHSVMHYSLEPAKIMVAWDGTVKILSFGISSMGAFGWNAAGKPFDVLYYMSPEQVRGEPIDARSNIFSLGAILYEMVTDQKAFPGEDSDRVGEQTLEKMPPAPHQLNRKLQPALSEVIMKALAKTPGARYQNGQELVNALENCKSQAAGKSAPKKTPDPGSQKSSEPQAHAEGSVPLKKSAAAGAGTVSTGATSLHSTASKAQPDASSPPVAHLSATVAEPEKAEPGFRVDPMMDQGHRSAAGGNVSFSDVSELPPLKEEYVAPPPPANELIEPALPLQKVEQSKPKLPPRQVVKKAVIEIKKTPPKLFIYSIGGAVAVILLVITIIALRINSDSAGEENTSTLPSANKPSPSDVTAVPPVAPNAAKPGAAALRATAPEHIVADEPRQISVRPKYNARKPKVPAAPVVVPGQLTVNSTPEGAEIRVDDQSDPSWVTPFNMSGLMPGAHTVRVSKPGYSSETRTIEVASNSKSFLVVQLAQVTATAIVSSEPGGAAVFLDGRDTGHVTPVQLSVEKPGTHTFTVKKQGYLEENATAMLQSAQTFHFSPTLKALGTTDDIKIGGKFKKIFGGGDTSGMVAVSIKTQPKGAQVAVNNRIVDKPSPVEFYLNPGTYVLDVTMSGYQKIHRVIEVRKGAKVAIEETMQHE
jgi:eukaryotic-like serine/threonine-protein kinase